MPDSVNTLDFSVAGAVTVSTVATEEMPYSGDVSNITASVTTAPTGADLVLDVLKNGTSIFATALGVVASGKTAQGTSGGVAVADTKISFEFTGNGDPDIKAGETLLIDTELVQVVGNVSGTSGADGSTAVYSATVTRGYDGTVAAAHANGASIFPGRPRILAGQTNSTTPNLGKLSEAPQFVAGDTIAVNVTQVGSTVAGSGLGVTVEITQR